MHMDPRRTPGYGLATSARGHRYGGGALTALLAVAANHGVAAALADTTVENVASQRTGRLLLNLILVRLGYPPAIIFKNERTKYLSAMRKADAGDLGPMGELIARSVTNNLYRFVIPAVAGPARLVPLASLADKKTGLTANALRVAVIRGRLRAQKSGQGTWLSSKKWVQEYQKNKYSRG